MSYTKGHFIVKCDTCAKVISQCRCFNPHKEIIYETCPDCLKKKQEQL